MMNHRYGTFCAEPSSEDAWDDTDMTPEQQFDILFGYAEERHRGHTYMDEVAPYGSENPDDVEHYDYADGYER
jgi:hypothetical protein